MIVSPTAAAADGERLGHTGAQVVPDRINGSLQQHYPHPVYSILFSSYYNYDEAKLNMVILLHIVVYII